MTQSETWKKAPGIYTIIGAAMEVHRELRPEFLEAVFQKGLILEFERRQIRSKREHPKASV